MLQVVVIIASDAAEFGNASLFLIEYYNNL